MKRHTLFRNFCMILMVIIMCISAWAGETRVHIDEVGVSLTIPSGYEIFIHGTKANDPRFEAMGLDGQTMENMLSTELYLTALTNDLTSEIAITMAPNDFYEDYNLLGINAVKLLVESLYKDLFEEKGMEFIDYDIYQHEQALFVKYRFKNPATGGSAIQYSTIYDGKDINITFWSYDGDVSFGDWLLAERVTETIVFDKEPQKIPEKADTPSFIYTDKNAGISFTVPQNWVEEDFKKEREYITAKFACNTYPGTLIMYSGSDMWEEMPPSDRVGLCRADLSNEALGDDLMYSLLEEMGCKRSDISKVTFNGLTYYQSKIKGNSDFYGVDLIVEMVVSVRVKDGWIYQFYFGGDNRSEAYKDYLSLLQSVKYPVSTVVDTNRGGVEKVVKNDIDDSNNGNVDGFNNGDVILPIVLVAVVCLAVFLIYRYAVQKKFVKNSNIQNESEPVNSTTNCCRYCGTQIPSENSFCHKCGHKVKGE